MLTSIKVLIILFLLKGMGNIQAIFKKESVSSPFSGVSRYIIFLPKLKRRGRLFLRGASRGTAL